MSSIDKLAIRGVRAFSDEDLSVIQFYTPLTVIIGHNGSGKTTVIECLKYITTGDMPPNTKGGAFVHDPHIAGKREVRAEVKLRFRNANGERMICDRRIQVSSKKTGTGHTMKTLEGTLSYLDKEREMEGGKRRAVSTRCSDLDEEIPRLLGVSKAILDNVIFCHQEESNWPLSEPSALKKKFDEIFDSTKYTKALDHIKAIRKEQLADLKAEREKLVALKSDRERAKRLEDQTQKLKLEIEEKQKSYDQLDAEVREQTELNKKFYEQATQYSSIVSKGQSLIERQRTIEEHVSSLQLTISEIDASDESLLAMLSNHNETVDADESKLEEMRHKKTDLENTLDDLRRRERKINQELGTLQGDAERHETAVEDLHKLIRDISEGYNLENFHNINVKSNRVNEFLTAFNEVHSDMSDELNSVKAENAYREKEKKDEVEKYSSEQTSLMTSKSSLEEQVGVLRSRSDALQKIVEEYNVTESTITHAEQNLEDYRSRYKKLKDDQEKGNFDVKIRELSDEIRVLEVKRECLYTDIASLHNTSEVRARLEVKTADLKKKKDIIESIMKKHDKKFRKITGNQLSSEGAESQITKLYTGKTREKSHLEESLSTTNARLADSNDNQKRCSEKLQKLKSQFSDYQKKIESVCEGNTLDEMLKETEDALVGERRNLASLEHMARFYQRMLDQGKHQRQCWTCQRDMSDGEFAVFEEHLQVQIKSAPEKTESAKSAVEDWEEQLELLRSLQPDGIAMKQIENTDMPEAKLSLEKAEDLQKQLSDKVTKIEEDLAKINDEIKEMEPLKSAFSDLTRLQREAVELASDIANVESEVGESSAQQSTTEIQSEIENIGETMRRRQRELDGIVSERDRLRVGVSAADTSVHKSELHLSELRHKVKDRQANEQRINEISTEMAESEQKIKDIQERIRSTQKILDKLSKDLSEIMSENSERENVTNSRLMVITKSVEELETAVRTMNKYTSSGGEKRLVDCQKNIKEMEQQTKEVSENITQIQVDIDGMIENRAENEKIKRNLNDNIKYRENNNKLLELKEELEILDIPAAEKAKDRYDRDFENLRQNIAGMASKQARLGGEIEMSQSSLNEKKTELTKDYKDIKTKYLKQLIKVKMTDLANQDLDKYGQALDKAIMSYHSYKMKEINETIEYLWTKTYQGTDIDKIMIVSDSESARSNRSYNYRVVMLKNNVELDMRGRCSAGQKVLASIIVRLALAESFSTNCGLLALDEPTTNLDRENVSSLAKALADLIQERRSQANFQLIVITHDEDMLNALSSNDVLDKYWLVSRNHRQKSVIDRQSIKQW